MMNNSHGKFIIGLFIILMLPLVGLTVYQTYTINNDDLYIEEYVESKIKDIEEDGYLTDSIRNDIKVELINETIYSEFDITGTSEKVESGETVYIEVEARAYNKLGTVAERHHYLKESIAN